MTPEVFCFILRQKVGFGPSVRHMTNSRTFKYPSSPGSQGLFHSPQMFVVIKKKRRRRKKVSVVRALYKAAHRPSGSRKLAHLLGLETNQRQETRGLVNVSQSYSEPIFLALPRHRENCHPRSLETI